MRGLIELQRGFILNPIAAFQPPPPTVGTLDPTVAGLTLSGGNLTISTTGSPGGRRSQTARVSTTGVKYQFECTHTGTQGIGFVTSTVVMTSGTTPGGDPNWWAYWPQNNAVRNNGGYLPSFNGMSANTAGTITILLDGDVMRMYTGGNVMTPPVTGFLGKTLYACLALFGGSGADSATINLGATGFSMTGGPAAGAIPWG